MFKSRLVFFAFAITILLFFAQTPVFALEWETDLRKGLDEAHERGAPAFIFLTQLT